jgi:hypothetical protein
MSVLSDYCQFQLPILLEVSMLQCCERDPVTDKSHRRHVHADLRAYLCTHEQCGMAMFEQKRAWVDHEMENHWRSWSCHLCNFDCDRQSDMSLHLELSHRKDLSEENKHSMAYMISRPLDYIDASRCLLCDWGKVLLSKGSVTMVSRASFMGHLAHHLEQLALFAIPRVIPGEDFDSLGANHAADHGSETSQSIESLSFVQAEHWVESATNVDTTSSASSHTHEWLPRNDNTSVNLVAITQAFFCRTSQ